MRGWDGRTNENERVGRGLGFLWMEKDTPAPAPPLSCHGHCIQHYHIDMDDQANGKLSRMVVSSGQTKVFGPINRRSVLPRRTKPQYSPSPIFKASLPLYGLQTILSILTNVTGGRNTRR